MLYQQDQVAYQRMQASYQHTLTLYWQIQTVHQENLAFRERIQVVWLRHARPTASDMRRLMARDLCKQRDVDGVIGPQ
ncbi:hypothetical protein BH10CHL1_BH10CHL1_51200 [soil metagenome]